MIQVIGLTTITVQEGQSRHTQCIILTKTDEKYYDYTFTPDYFGRYTLRTNPTVDRNVEMKPLQPTELVWQNNKLMLRTALNSTVIFDAQTHTFVTPTQWFQGEDNMLPKRKVLIIQGNSEGVLPFIDKYKSITFADEWTIIPASIPEDIIVLGNNPFPLNDILLRLPQRTQAIFVHPEV